MFTLPSAVRVVKTPVIPPPDDDAYGLALACLADSPPVTRSPLPFPDWLAEQAEQLRHPGDGRSTWLARKIDELAQLAHYLDARDPETFDGRLAVTHQEAKERAYFAGYRAAEAPEPEYGYGAGR